MGRDSGAVVQSHTERARGWKHAKIEPQRERNRDAKLWSQRDEQRCEDIEPEREIKEKRSTRDRREKDERKTREREIEIAEEIESEEETSR